MVKSLGADKVIDYTKEDLTKNGQTYDVIFDAVGKSSATQSEGLLKENGIFLTVQTTTHENMENIIFLKDLLKWERSKRSSIGAFRWNRLLRLTGMSKLDIKRGMWS